MRFSARRSAWAPAVIVLAATSCTSGALATDSGRLVVRAEEDLGPVNTLTGHFAGEFAMSRARVRARSSSGWVTIARTDRHGVARFILAPGTYVVRLADLAGFNGAGGPIDCGVGDAPARVRVWAHRTVRAAVFCVHR